MTFPANPPPSNADVDKPEPLTGDNTTTTHDTFGSTDAGNVPTVAGSETSFLNEFQQVLPDKCDKSIQTILSRYSRVGTYDLMSDNLQAPFDLRDMITNLCGFNKLDGTLGFTCTFSMKIVWNSDPFIQGLYCLYFVPPNAPVIDVPNHNAKIRATYATGCPHVVFNLAESTSVVLDVPYVGPYSFIPFGRTALPSIGTFGIVPIVMAESTTSIGKLDYTVYLALKDVKTYGNYPAAATLPVHTPSLAILQSEEVKKATSYASHFGNARSFIEKAGEYIPQNLIPEGAFKTADWVLGGAQKVCDLLGWSKPYSTKALVSTCELSYKDITTGDATFSGAKLAMNIDAGLGQVDMSGRGVDEMQISEILSRPNFVPGSKGLFRWKTSDAVNNKLIDIPIGPASFVAPVGDSNQYICHTQMSYLANAFRKWRGSIRLRVVPVCTKFHSGRLRINYWPPCAAGPNPECTQYSYTHVLDVRDASTWEFEIPYIRAEPWCDLEQDNGNFTLFVDTPLRNGGAAKNEIYLAMFVAAGSTFELAIPSIALTNPPVLRTSVIPSTAELQAPGIEGVKREIATIIPLAPDSSSSSVAAHSLAIGDPVRSLRAIFKKFWPGTNPVWPGGTNHVITQFPIPNAVLYAPERSRDRDMISYLIPLFGFWRGGMRVYAQNYYPCRVTASPFRALSISTHTGQAASTSIDYDEVNTFAPVGLSEPTKFELPYSFNTLCRNTFIPIATEETSQQLNIDYYLGSANMIISRAMADDFDAGFLIGADRKSVV